jgi:isopenicillin N synthase-like dioxygenase
MTTVNNNHAAKHDPDYTRQVRDIQRRPLPVLDLGPLLAGDSAGIDGLARQLREVAEGLGFMCLVNHGVPAELTDAMFDRSREFFALPLDDKLALEIDPHERGYQPLRMTVVRESRYYERPQNDFYESYNFGVDYADDNPNVIARKRMFGRNRWPASAPELPGVAMRYLDRMGALATSFLPVWSRALEVPDDFFAPYFSRAHFYTRMIHYPVKPGLATDDTGHGAHSDTSFNTFLPAAAEPGLQVMDTDGSWILPDLPADSIIVNFGQYLERWSNGLVRATPHRVIPPVENDRYSLAFFVCPNLDAVGECLPSCQAPDNPAKYDPESFWQFHTDYMSRVYPHFEERWENEQPPA